MPLNNVSGNINRQQSLKYHNLKDGYDDISTRLQYQSPSLSIQHMLKSTTELGDVGDFFQRSSRVPRSSTSSSQLQAQPYLGRRHSHQYRDPPIDIARYYHHQHRTESSGRFSRNSSTRSTVSAHQYHSGSERRGPDVRRRPPNDQYGQRVNRDHSRYGIQSHRSLASLKHHDRDSENGSLSPRSFRSRRSYRPRRGPPRSVDNTHLYYDSRFSEPGIFPDRNAATPAQERFKPADQSMQERRSEYGRSIRSFRGVPFTRSGDETFQGLPCATSLRAATPAAVQTKNERIESMTSLASGLTSPTNSIVPFYYDYTESFHGSESLLRPNEPNIITDHVQNSMPHQRQQRHRTVVDRAPRYDFEARPAELLARHNRWPSGVSNKSQNGRSLKDDLNEAFPDTSGEHSKLHVVDEEIEQNSVSSPKRRFSPTNNTFFTNANRSPRNLSNLAARVHSPLDGNSIGNIQSIDDVAVGADLSKIAMAAIPIRKDHPSPVSKLPSLRSRSLATDLNLESRPSLSPTLQLHNPPGIVSPYPERPTSSHNRRRFNKILGSEHVKDLYLNTTLCRLAVDTPRDGLERIEKAHRPVRISQPTCASGANSDNLSRLNTHLNLEQIENARWSGVTSHDKSTIESLLDKHIECLGLQPTTTIIPSVETPKPIEDSTEWIDTSEDSAAVNAIEMQKLHTESIPQDTSLENRPTSLTSSVCMRLVPRRLFAGTDYKSSNLPPRDSGSATESSSLKPDTARPSFGWLTLNSEYLDVGREMSPQTLSSGHLADVESGQTLQKFKMRRDFSPDAGSEAVHSVCQDSNNINRTSVNGIPAHGSEEHLVIRDASQRRRKVRIRLKHPREKPSSPSKIQLESDEQKFHQCCQDLARVGLTRVPISTIDGFAELNGDSANDFRQSLSPRTEDQEIVNKQIRSGILPGIPAPSKGMSGLRRKHSASTIRSDRSKNSVISPVNTSRLTSKLFRQNISLRGPAPQLAQPDLGPVVSVRTLGIPLGSPAGSSHSEPVYVRAEKVSSPPKCQHPTIRSRWWSHSVRGIIPKSKDNAEFMDRQASRSHMQQKPTFSQDCRAPKVVSFVDGPTFPETGAMSDFAYRRYKIMEKVRGWCRGSCMRRARVRARERLSRLEGLLID